MYALRIRGIYATALTNLALKGGLLIVQPSPVLRERFNLERVLQPYDVDINDLDDRQGVLASGRPEAIEKITSILQQELPDLITRSFKFGLYSIYLGLIQSTGSQGTVVELGSGVGFLPKGEIEGEPQPGQAALVQVTELPGRGKRPGLRSSIGIPGRYAVLISGGRVTASRKIRDHKERMRLSWLGAELAPQGWGVVWRTAAFGKSESALAEDLERLSQLAKDLPERVEAAEPPALLVQGEKAVQFEFPGGSKAKLDELRSEIIPTTVGHHKCRAYGEKLEVNSKEVIIGDETGKADLLYTVSDRLHFPGVGAEVAIEHVKPGGILQVLGRGKVTSSNPEKGLLELEREIKSSGTYDGLGEQKEPGDRAVTRFHEGNWSYKTSYYSKAGALKGEYYNVNTPIEIYPDRVRYVDLEIDVVRWPSGEVQPTMKLLDEQKLLKALEEGYITEGLARRARSVAQAIIEGAGALTEI